MSAGQGATDAAALHQALVDRLVQENAIHFPEVEAAFRAVPRHLFLPGVPLDEVYSDKAIVTRWIDSVPASSSSQPAAMAIMLEQLGLKPGHRVLEIGAGTGYNAAVIAQIVGERGEVVTVDIDAEIVQEARSHLEAAGVTGVKVVCADGGLGYPDRAPYDRIILSVGAWDIAPPWVEQLKPDGRLLLPLWVRTAQKTVAFERAGDHLESVSVTDCAFMRLRGLFAGPEAFVPLGPEPGLLLGLDDRAMVNPETVYGLLTGRSQDWPVGVSVTLDDIWHSLSLWLALREPGYCLLVAQEALAQRLELPFLYEMAGGERGTIGLLSEGALCLLSRPADQPSPFPLTARCFGDGDAGARRLIDHMAAWEAAGRPRSGGLRIRAYPREVAYTPAPGEIVVPKHWTQLVFDWPRG